VHRTPNNRSKSQSKNASFSEKKDTSGSIVMSRLKRDSKVVISGYYGFDNCGDEAVLLSIIRCLKKLSPDVHITVLSGNPDKTSALYGVHAINRWNFFQIFRALLGAHLLISGGGSLIQDVTSVRSPGYYLGVIRIALLLKKKVMIYAQGIGPLDTHKNRVDTAKVFNRCHTITVRDEASAKLLQELGVNPEVKTTCDPVLAMGRDDVSLEIIGDLLLRLGISETDGKKKNPLLFVSMRRWKDDRHLAPVAQLLDAQVAAGWDVLLVPAHFPEDAETCRLVSGKMETQPYVVDHCLSAEEFFALTAVSDRVFSMRLHGLICAMAVDTPMVGLSYDPKVDAFMQQCGLDAFCLAFDDADLYDKGMDCLRKMPPQQLDALSCYGKSLEACRLKLQELAWSTAKIAVNLVQL